jgi:hypothetical protein
MHALLEAVAHSSSRFGFQGYTADAIAESSHVIIGSLYQYSNMVAVTVPIIERELTRSLDDVVEDDYAADYKKR